MIVTFCGHSNYSSNENDKKRLLDLLEEIVQGKQVEFYLGGYGAFDSFALECTKKYKERHPTAKLIFVTPYLDKWLDDRKEFLQSSYDSIIYPELERVPKKFAIAKRNEWMVNQADHVFAYVKSHYGGAYKMLLYAHKHKKSYTNLYQGNYELY